MAQKFLIAPYTTGMQNNVTPFLIPDDAWAELNNCHINNGRIERRLGSSPMNTAVAGNVQQLYSRLAINIGVITGAGTFGPFIVPGVVWAVGQLFSVGDTIFTVITPGANMPMLSTVAGQVGTFSTTNGSVTINTGIPTAGTIVYYYPSTPVMGIDPFQTDVINAEDTWAFDTQFAYQYLAGHWQRLAAQDPAAPGANTWNTWTGTNAQFFWGVNYKADTQVYNNFYVTNFNQADGLRYWDGAVLPAPLQFWSKLDALILNNAGDTLVTCLIVQGYKGRLVLFNTIELDAGTGNNKTFQSRIRFSDDQEIVRARQNICFNSDLTLPGFITVPTAEAIVSVGFIKDKLIVYCEESTWLLGSTGNSQQPFKLVQLNSELGVESTFSITEFDRAAIGIGNTGILATNGVNVERIDQKIQSSVFQIRNTNSGVQRVQGIRDYPTQLILWTYPSMESVDVWPDTFLVYNYKIGSWSFYDDSITAFGYFSLEADLQWNQVDAQWQDINWAWQNAINQQAYRVILGGNQEGYVMAFYSGTVSTTLAQALSITNIDFTDPTMPILTIINHNLKNGAFIFINFCAGAVIDINAQIFQVTRIDLNTVTIVKPGGASAGYIGGGVAQLVPNITALSKQYNFFQGQYRNCGISQVDFQITRGTEGATILCDYSTSSSTVSLVDDSTASGAIVGTCALDLGAYPSLSLVPNTPSYETTQDRVWHTIYLQADGTYVQIALYFTDEQLLDPTNAFSVFVLHSMLFSASPTSVRLG